MAGEALALMFGAGPAAGIAMGRLALGVIQGELDKQEIGAQLAFGQRRVARQIADERASARARSRQRRAELLSALGASNARFGAGNIAGGATVASVAGSLGATVAEAEAVDLSAVESGVTGLREESTELQRRANIARINATLGQFTSLLGFGREAVDIGGAQYGKGRLEQAQADELARQAAGRAALRKPGGV